LLHSDICALFKPAFPLQTSGKMKVLTAFPGRVEISRFETPLDFSERKEISTSALAFAGRLSKIGLPNGFFSVFQPR